MSSNDSLVSSFAVRLGEVTFGWMDYSLFGAMLGISVAIGIYFGFFSKKQDNTTEYLLGGKTMGYFPVAMSLIASHLSGITLLGIPSEVYQYGTQYAAIVFTTTFTCLVTAYVYLPVFYKLQLTSTFEYLEVRFSRPVRTFASVLYTVNLIKYIPIVVYVPALAFSQATGFGVHTVTPVICIICIFYTTFGGLKAVVWTDTVQFAVTLGSLFAVLFLGISSIGGVENIWRISEEGNRIVFWDMNPSPFVRTSFWSMSVGMTTLWFSQISVNQGCVQKFLSVPTLTDARKTITITCVGLIVVKLVSVFTGLIIFAKYHDCDPLLTNVVKRSDQVLPYYVMDVAGKIPGLPGLFLAGLVSSALSAMSASLNTVAGTIYEDFIASWLPDNEHKEARAANIMKVTVASIGFTAVAMVFLVERLGGIFHLNVSLSGITAGALLGLFTLGMLVPWANTKGAIFGGLLSLSFMTWIVGGAQWNIAQNNIRYDPLPTSTDNCPYPLNMTVWTKPTLPPVPEEDEPMILYTISFLYYALVGTLLVVIPGTVASFATGSMNLEDVNRDHITPFMHRFLPPEKYSEVPLKVVQTNLEDNIKAVAKQ